MQTQDILRIKILDLQAEASGQLAIAALLVIVALCLLRSRQP